MKNESSFSEVVKIYNSTMNYFGDVQHMKTDSEFSYYNDAVTNNAVFFCDLLF